MASNTVHAPGAIKQSGALVYLLHSAPGPVVAGHWAGLLSAPAGLGTRPPLPDLPPVKHKEWGSSSLAIIVLTLIVYKSLLHVGFLTCFLRDLLQYVKF